MRNTHASFGRGAIHVAVGLLAFATACKRSGREVNVASGSLDTVALAQFRTFNVMSPTGPSDTLAVVGAERNRVTGVVMDMDPMLSTSLVGRAIRQDLSDAFASRGYQAVDSAPNFKVFYYAGTGHVVDTRSSEKSYRSNGQKITTQTTVFPAGTIIVDVVDARTDSLVWRGTGVSEIPKNPDDYAHAIHTTVNKIVGTFPKAPH